MAASMNNSAWLEWMGNLMGGVSRPQFAATLPPDRYHCVLDELPLHLIPRAPDTSLGLGNSAGAWSLNPACTISTDGEVPNSVALPPDLVSGFALQGTVAWVTERKSTFPFWLGPKLEEQVRELNSSRERIFQLKEDASLLVRAGILASQNDGGERDSGWQKRIEDAATLFRKKGYATLRGLIHPFHVAALRRYYRYLIRTGAIRLGDSQSPLRYAVYNEPVARFFHHQIAATFSAVAGEPLKPSYVYLASYRAGSELKKHTDREQCEFSITLCLDFSPEPALEASWPIHLDTTAGQVTVYQALGDGLAYRGTRLPHYRDPLPQHKTSTSIFFHYVAKDFAGSLD
jgi:hypothetical protein